MNVVLAELPSFCIARTLYKPFDKSEIPKITYSALSIIYSFTSCPCKEYKRKDLVVEGTFAVINSLF